MEIPQIRSDDIDSPVQIWRDDKSGRFYLRAINEGGFACIDLDLWDLAIWFGHDPEKFISSLSPAKTHVGLRAVSHPLRRNTLRDERAR
jgi:hypothetical protein